MKAFFRSRLFMVLSVISVVLGGFMIATAQQGRNMFIFGDLLGVIISPVQKGVTMVGNSVSQVSGYFKGYDELKRENEELKMTVRSMEQAMRDNERYRQENEDFRKLLNFNMREKSFDFEPAQVIAGEVSNWFKDYTIDKGSLDGVELYDPVINTDGLVGYISEVGMTWSKVTSIIDVQSKVGAIVVKSREYGVVEGGLEYAHNGLCQLNYLNKNTMVLKGDVVVTSGLGGKFPEEILIGTVTDVGVESHGISSYAVIKPAVNFNELKQVYVIKDFKVVD